MLHDLSVMEANGIGFLEFLTVAAISCPLLLLIFFAYAASRSADNPLRQVAGILAQRIGVTLGIGLVDLPVTLAVPPLGGLMDVASFLGLAAYWIVGFWKAGRAFMPPKSPAPPAPPTIVYMQPPTVQPQGQALAPVPLSYGGQTMPPPDHAVTLLQPGDD